MTGQAPAGDPLAGLRAAMDAAGASIAAWGQQIAAALAEAGRSGPLARPGSGVRGDTGDPCGDTRPLPRNPPSRLPNRYR